MIITIYNMKYLKSRTVWVVIFTFILNGFQAIQGSINPDIYMFINGILGMLAIYFKINPSQTYGENS